VYTVYTIPYRCPTKFFISSNGVGAHGGTLYTVYSRLDCMALMRRALGGAW